METNSTRKDMKTLKLTKLPILQKFLFFILEYFIQMFENDTNFLFMISCISLKGWSKEKEKFEWFFWEGEKFC